MDTFGLSFSPTQQNQNNQNPNNQSPTAGGSGSPIQDAIKVLSLRIPHITGPGGIAPPSLLNSGGGAGIGGGTMGQPGGLEEFLRRLFAGQMGQQGGSAPPPNVHPGTGGTEPGPVEQGPQPGASYAGPANRSPNTGFNGNGPTGPLVDGPTPPGQYRPPTTQLPNTGFNGNGPTGPLVGRMADKYAQ